MGVVLLKVGVFCGKKFTDHNYYTIQWIHVRACMRACMRACVRVCVCECVCGIRENHKKS